MTQKLVYGVGYVGYNIYDKNDKIGKFLATERINGRTKNTKIYMAWHHMLMRCYNQTTINRQPTYDGCSVCDEWLNFQNFAKWFSQRYKPGYELDKDLLVKGNKIYSPETCCVIPKEINRALTNSKINRGKLPIGITIDNRTKTGYIVQLNKGSKQLYLGTWPNIEKAFQVYKEAKEETLKDLAESYKLEIEDSVYNALKNYKIEITD